jgi:hypothetical protein
MRATNIASFFKWRALILHRFLVRAQIRHRCCIIYDATPYFRHLQDFCDRALSARPLPLPTRKLTGGGIPLLLRLGVLKKGSARLYAKKRLHLPILHRFFNARLILHRFLMRALILHRFLNARAILHRFLVARANIASFFSARANIASFFSGAR